MTIYREEIFGPVLGVVRTESLDEAIALVNANPYANGAAVFTRSGHAARVLPAGLRGRDGGRQRADPGADGVLQFGGWRNSLFGDLHVHGMDGVRFYTRTKVMTVALARRRQRRAGLPHAADGLMRTPDYVLGQRLGHRCVVPRGPTVHDVVSAHGALAALPPMAYASRRSAGRA